MRILLVHNHYQVPGGEDEVFEREKRLLEGKAHVVSAYERANSEIESYSPWQRLGLAPRTIWNGRARLDLSKLLDRERPDVAHFHNTFPLISPSAYSACRERGVAVVQTLHNPRLLCPSASFYRDGHLCEDCLGKSMPWPSVVHGCYRGSRVQSAVVASMLSYHRSRGTWRNDVDVYIAPSEFYRRKFIEGGLPPEKLVVKPHFVSADPGERTVIGEYALFVGRLAREKGVPTLLKAWSQLERIPLHIRGEGPLRGLVGERASAAGALIKLIPRLGADEMWDLLKDSRFLVWPSEGYYESFGLIAIEAFACGVPVIASRIGAMAEIVKDGRTGLFFHPGDSSDLAAKVAWAWSHPREMAVMGRAARTEYEAKYGAEQNYRMLTDIYARAALSARSAPQLLPSPAGRVESRAPTGAVPVAGTTVLPESAPVPIRPSATLPSHAVGLRKVLVVHNYYQQGGGEDVVFAAETALLRSRGLQVVEYREDNHRIEGMNRLSLAATTIWSRTAKRDLVSILRQEKPDVAHFHNTFPLVSPAAYYACREAGVPVVQTLHNYRILCAAGNLSRESRVCEDCLGKHFGWPGVLHGCYRQSRLATSVVASMVATHWAMGTWTELVDLYIALTQFSRQKFIEGGLPPEKIVVKPNFADLDSGPRTGPRDCALYLGRLSQEKGVGLLIRAWRTLSEHVPLCVVGDGPLRSSLESQARDWGLTGVTFLGRLERREALQWMRRARFLIVPSEWYEAFPLVVVEAFASGTPVIATRLGALEEIIEEGRTGLHFGPGNVEELSRKVAWAWTHPQELEEMGCAARAEYDAKYTAERNCRMLVELYRKAARRASTATK